MLITGPTWLGVLNCDMHCLVRYGALGQFPTPVLLRPPYGLAFVPSYLRHFLVQNNELLSSDFTLTRD